MKVKYIFKLLFFVLHIFFFSQKLLGQVTIFTETMGNSGGTVSIASHESANGFDNDSYTMSASGCTNPGDIRITSASTGYLGASGNSNSFLTSTNGEYGFGIAGIVTTGYNTLLLTFGVRKEGASGTAFATLAVEYSTDGSSWNAITVNGLPVTSNAAGWYLISNVSVPSGADNQANLRLRWRKTGTIACRIDDIKLTGTIECTSPDALAFIQQPTDVVQGIAMSPVVTVKAYCTSSGATATNYTGNVTLTVSGGACGYVSQTVAAISGIATFNNIIFTRSVQTGITLTATATGLTNATSNTFNVSDGVGSITTTYLRDDNFSGSTPTWSWFANTSTVGSGGALGADLTGVVTQGGNTYLRKTYTADNASSERGTKTVITFENTTSLNSYNSLTFSFKIASLNSSGTTTSCLGCGVDSPDSLFIETSLDNGATWHQLLIYLGNNDKLFNFNSTYYNLTLGSLTTMPNTSTQSAFSVSIPTGTSQFMFRMIARNNRTGENWAIDDLKLIGETYSGGSVTDPLPTAQAIGATTICSGNSTELTASATNSNGSLLYSWEPSIGLSAINTATVTATLSSSQTYTVTITDADNCVAISNAVTISVDECVVLPITVYDFKVNRISESKNLIEWKSNDEENLFRYELEKSEDGFNYQLLNYTLPLEQYNYTDKHYFVVDSSVVRAANYYKLFSLDNNGKRLYHDVTYINEQKTIEDFSILYSNDGVTVLIDENGVYTDALIYSSMGQLIKKFNIEILKTNNIQINNSEFASGIYFIQLNGKSKIVSKKIILKKE